MDINIEARYSVIVHHFLTPVSNNLRLIASQMMQKLRNQKLGRILIKELSIYQEGEHLCVLFVLLERTDES